MKQGFLVCLCAIVTFLLAVFQMSCTHQTSFSDPQGNTYETVSIGEQIWMAKNLLYDVGEGCYCYEDDPVQCDEMGRIYTWEAALRAADEIDGWHLPSKHEWQELVEFCGPDSATAYLSLVSDTTGFNPQWSGVRVSTGVYKAKGLESANYWSSTVSDTSSALAYSVAIMSKLQMTSPHNYPVINACSVRLVKDR